MGAANSMIMMDPNHSASMNEVRMEATVRSEGTCGGTAEFTLGAASIPPGLQAMGLTVDQLQQELDAINRIFKAGLPQMRVQPAMIGMLIFLIGFIVSFASIVGNFGSSRRDGGGIRPDGFLIGFGISFCGMMVSVVGSMWLSKKVLAAIEDVRRQLNDETNPRWAPRQLAWRIDGYALPKRTRVWFVACYSTQPVAMNVPTAMAVPGYGYGAQGMPPQPPGFPGQYPPMGAHPYPMAPPGQYAGPYGQPYYPGGPGIAGQQYSGQGQPPMGMNALPPQQGQPGQQGYPPQPPAGQQAPGVPAYFAPPNVAVRNPAASAAPAGASAGSGGGSGGGGQTSKQGSDALNY